jgi:prepilin-type N-terminal cleavage/methylation domain-containing protein
MQKNQRGFTIIELIVVIAIIALLSGIVATNVTKYINKAKQARIQNEFTNFQKALTAFYAKYGDYPGTQLCAIDPMNCLMGISYCPADINCNDPDVQGPFLQIGSNKYYLSEFHKINWSTANATFYDTGSFYRLYLADNDFDGKIGCGYIGIVDSTWNEPAYKNILCQDCPYDCGNQDLSLYE